MENNVTQTTPYQTLCVQKLKQEIGKEYSAFLGKEICSRHLAIHNLKYNDVYDKETIYYDILACAASVLTEIVLSDRLKSEPDFMLKRMTKKIDMIREKKDCFTIYKDRPIVVKLLPILENLASKGYLKDMIGMETDRKYPSRHIWLFKPLPEIKQIVDDWYENRHRERAAMDERFKKMKAQNN